MIRGTIVAMVTPFDEQGALDLNSARKLAVWLAENGADAIFLGGTTGEGLLLSLNERERLVEAIIEAVGGRVSILAQVGCATTSDTIELAKHAAKAGADGLVVLSPFFFTVDSTAMIAHFASVAGAVPETPVYLYNIPENTRNNISPDIVKALLNKTPNFAGIKDSSKDLVLLQKYLAVAPEGFAVYVGSDSVLLPGLAVGAPGVVSAASNVFPEVVRDIVCAFNSGDLNKARASQQYLNKLLGVLKIGPSLAGYKSGLALRGIYVGGMRPPLRNMSPEEQVRFEEAFWAAYPMQ
jgi:4-hydroxy-tetrahydrodipicolinate synthase